MKRIGDILTRYKEAETVRDDVIYKQVTIGTNYKGVRLRGTKRGIEIGTKNQWLVKAGQFILSRIDARNSAFGIIPEELESALVTNDFMAYEVNEDQVDRDFFNVFLQSPQFLKACIKASRGNTNRKRVQEEFFLNYEVNLPDLTHQRLLIQKIERAKAAMAIAKGEIAEQKALLTKLKQAILQEAIQGKLTADWRAKNPDTEPASELLKRIQTEKARLIAEKKIRKEKLLPEITPEEIPFEIPEGWEWCRLGQIIEKTESGWSPKCLDNSAPAARWGVLKTTAVQAGEYLEFENKELPLNLTPRPKHETQVGDILMTRAGPANRVGICAYVATTRKKLMISDKIIRFHPLFVNGRYIEAFANSPQFQELIEESKQGMAQSQVNISQTNLKNTVVPLPPLAEQAAIVSRVEALMATCRDLETEIDNSRTHAADLLQAVLKEAFSPPS